MTPIPIQSGRVAFLEGLMQAASAVQKAAALAADLGEDATIRTCIVIDVHSEAEVDGAAADMGVVPERPRPGQWRAVAHMGAVTVTVAFVEPSAETVETACGRAAGEVPAVTA